jgi:uncharacterized protein
MSEIQINPISLRERIAVIDVLRGFAILGILIGNMQWFSGYGMMPPAVDALNSAADNIIKFLVHFFVEGKFYSIFSFLFGFGFALQIARSEERGDLKASLFKRRLFWLLIIGLLHAYFIWAGDILSIYAVSGFILLLFRKKSNESLIKWVIGFWAAPVLVYLLLYILFVFFAPPEATLMPDAAKQFEGWNAAVNEVAQGSYWQIFTGYNLKYVLFRYIGLFAEMRWTKLLAMFMLGFYAYRQGFFQNLSENKPMIRRVFIFGLIFGILGNALLAFAMPLFPPSLLGLAGTIGYVIGVPSLALFFIAGISLLWQRQSLQNFLAILAPVGRMALTNYLMQSIICVFLFYGYGFGLFGTFRATAATLTAFAIFIFQIAFSSLWLRFFSHGPMEWIWRQLTYGKRLDLRIQQRSNEISLPS